MAPDGMHLTDKQLLKAAKFFNRALKYPVPFLLSDKAQGLGYISQLLLELVAAKRYTGKGV